MISDKLKKMLLFASLLVLATAVFSAPVMALDNTASASNSVQANNTTVKIHVFSDDIPEMVEYMLLKTMSPEKLRTISLEDLKERVAWNLKQLSDEKVIDPMSDNQTQALMDDHIAKWLYNYRATRAHKMAMLGDAAFWPAVVRENLSWLDLVRQAYLADPTHPFDLSSLTNPAIPLIYAAQPRAGTVFSPETAKARAQNWQGHPLTEPYELSIASRATA